MGPGFWIKRLVIAFAVAAALLFIVQFLKGIIFEQAIAYALGWGAVSAGVFTLVGYLRFKRNPACMLPTRPAKSDGALK